MLLLGLGLSVQQLSWDGWRLLLLLGRAHRLLWRGNSRLPSHVLMLLLWLLLQRTVLPKLHALCTWEVVRLPLLQI